MRVKVITGKNTEKTEKDKTKQTLNE